MMIGKNFNALIQNRCMNGAENSSGVTLTMGKKSDAQRTKEAEEQLMQLWLRVMADGYCPRPDDGDLGVDGDVWAYLNASDLDKIRGHTGGRTMCVSYDGSVWAIEMMPGFDLANGSIVYGGTSVPVVASKMISDELKANVCALVAALKESDPARKTQVAVEGG